MSKLHNQVLTAVSIALAVYSQGLFAFDFATSDKFSAVGGWRIHHESGRVSFCDPGTMNFDTGKVAAPKCSPWSNSLGKGGFRLVKQFSDDSGVFVIDVQSGKMATCNLIAIGKGAPRCSPLSNS